MTLTYIQFHALFVVPPAAGLLFAVRRRNTAREPWRPRPAAVALLSLIALAYTTPWDNYLIGRGVWWYGEGRVAATLWRAPVEEYLFIALQPVVAGLWLHFLPAPSVLPSALPTATARVRAAGAAAGAAVGAVGLGLLSTPSTFYLGAILAWSGPVLALQWGVGWPVIWRLRRTVALGVLVPSAYLWVVDAIAIDRGVWIIAEQYTTGVAVAGLPVEEAAFFVVTNRFVVQGLVLFDWVVARWR
jgi:lycopene cyclase domain-containing protein